MIEVECDHWTDCSYGPWYNDMKMPLFAWGSGLAGGLWV